MRDLNRKNEVTQFVLIGATFLLSLVFAGAVRADWAEDFDSGFSQSWFFDATDDIGNPPLAGFSTFAIVENGADDFLQMSHSEIALRDGGGGAADVFGFVNESFTDMTIVAEINAGPSVGQQNLLGVFGRANALTGTAYAAGVDFANSFFAIGRSDDFEDFFFILSSDTSVIIDANETYEVQLFLLGSNLVARLIESSTGQILSTITTVDGLYASGVGGILAETEYDFLGNPLGPVIGTFDDVRAVPEPSGGLLIGVGGLVMGFVRTRGNRGKFARPESKCLTNARSRPPTGK